MGSRRDEETAADADLLDLVHDLARLRAADAPCRTPVLVGEERPRFPEAWHVGGDVDRVHDALERDEEPLLPAPDRLLGDRILLGIEEHGAPVDALRLPLVVDRDPKR